MNMKKWLCVLLSLMLCVAASLSFAEEQTVSGFVMEKQMFAEMVQRFRTRGFAADVNSVTLSQTQLYTLAVEAPDRLMPDVALQMSEAAEISEDVEEMTATVQYLLEIALLLQEKFPEVFVFNVDMVQAHVETGFGYAIAEPELWLWADNAQGVMLPVFFHDETTGELIDGVYLLNAVNLSEGGVYYTLYNDAETVVDYLMSVELNSGKSLFQRMVIQWYITSFVEQGIAGDEKVANTADDGAAGEKGEDAGTQAYIGFARITASDSANVRSEGNGEAAIVGAVRAGNTYKVLSVSESGWYELLLTDGTTGYVSPKLVDYTER